MRRDHVFEDSFHQLRMRTPDEMGLKLSVSFQGEEGIDAGGVSREWFQVGGAWRAGGAASLDIALTLYWCGKRERGGGGSKSSEGPPRCHL